MTLPASGNAISLSQIQTEFGGSNPISLGEYYAAQNGAVPPPGVGVPAYGNPLNMGSFAGTSKPIMYYRNASSVTVVDTGFGYNDTIITFTNPSVAGILKPDYGTMQVRTLIVGPGGNAVASGGRAGGGGAGGAIDLSGLSLTSGTSYTVTVGKPNDAVYDSYGALVSGGPSVSSSIGSVLVATVGGVSTGSGDYGRYAVAGDSGYVTLNGTVIAQSYVGGNYSGSGYKTGSDWGAGGGGGAGGRGVDGRALGVNAYGGNGISSGITGTTTSYASGGNGASSCGYLAAVAGGGGYAGGYHQAGGNGAANTGGGGGAGCAASGGLGGTGIIVVRGRFTAVAF